MPAPFFSCRKEPCADSDRFAAQLVRFFWLENLADLVIGRLEVQPRLSVRGTRYHSTDFRAQRDQLSSQLTSRILQQRGGRSKSGKGRSGRRGDRRGIQLGVDLRQKLILERAPIRID